MTLHTTPRVVVIGGGFGGLSAIKALKKADADLTLIDRRNFHTFQPLLYQVATGALSPANITATLRTMVRHQRNARVLQAEVHDIRIDEGVVLSDRGDVPFDYLVLAAGARNFYFGNDHWQEHAYGLKTVEQALAIRRRVLRAFEKAEWTENPDERRQLMTFVVVGGGPTGVEMAGAIAELAQHTLVKEFRCVDTRQAQVILVEGLPRVLAPFSESLSAHAQKDLRKLGVDLRLGAMVQDIHAEGLTYKDDAGVHQIKTANIVWGAGVAPSPLAQSLCTQAGLEAIKGRVPVTSNCSLETHSHIFAIGDLAGFTDAKHGLLPGVAPVAMQQGRYVARVIQARLKNKPYGKAFRYRDKGSMATIGRNKAVAETSGLRFTGLIAWLAWLFVHIMYLVGFENRILVLMQWAWNYITKGRGARLITRVKRSTDV